MDDDDGFEIEPWMLPYDDATQARIRQQGAENYAWWRRLPGVIAHLGPPEDELNPPPDDRP
jgi:hypothetical protein